MIHPRLSFLNFITLKDFTPYPVKISKEAPKATPYGLKLHIQQGSGIPLTS